MLTSKDHIVVGCFSMLLYFSFAIFMSENILWSIIGGYALWHNWWLFNVYAHKRRDGSL